MAYACQYIHLLIYLSRKVISPREGIAPLKEWMTEEKRKPTPSHMNIKKGMDDLRPDLNPET